MIKDNLEQTETDFGTRLSALEKRQEARREKLNYMHEGATYSYVDGLRYTRRKIEPQKGNIIPDQAKEAVKGGLVKSMGVIRFVLEPIAFLLTILRGVIFLAFWLLRPFLHLIAYICVFYTATVFGLTVFTMGIPLLLFMTDPAAGVVIYGTAFLTMTVGGWLLENEESPIFPKNRTRNAKTRWN